jgi:hypothetical protein
MLTGAEPSVKRLLSYLPKDVVMSYGGVRQTVYSFQVQHCVEIVKNTYVREEPLPLSGLETEHQ